MGIKPYLAAVAQTGIQHIRDHAKIKDGNIKRLCELIEFLCSQETMTRKVKLVVFPEFSLQGPGGKIRMEGKRLTNKETIDLAVKIPGEETDVIAEKAKKYGVYICAAGFEVDDEWPGVYFNCAFIIDDRGKVILKYRKVNTTNNPLELACSPHDLMERYTQEIFPVVDTPLGRLSCSICFDISFPEVYRASAMKGAEVFLRPTSGHGELWVCLARARAADNAAYFITANNGPWTTADCIFPRNFIGGNSMIVDFNGNIIARASSVGVEEVAMATIDIEALRTFRTTSYNPLAILRTQIYLEAYQQSVWPQNSYLTEIPNTLKDRDARGLLEQTVNMLIERGVLKRPSKQ